MIEPDDGYRLYEAAGERAAVFCRLEHVVPWAIQGPHWEPGAMPRIEDEPPACSQCDAALGEVRLTLVRHRGEHRIADAFCELEHLRAWAAAGGRWA